MKRTILFLLLLATVTVIFAQDTITLAADPWPPFNMDPKLSANEGFMIEIARAVYEPLGYKVVYVTMPWTKALKETEDGAYSAVVGAALEDAEGFVFPKESQGQSSLTFYVRAGDTWKFSDIKSLEGKKLGVILDYSYGADMDEFLKDNPDAKWAFGDLPLQKNLAALKKGEIDIVLATTAVGEYTIQQMGMTSDIVAAGTDGSPDDVFIAFSPKNAKSAEYAKLLDEGMKKIRDNGTLAKILAKYGMKDWK